MCAAACASGPANLWLDVPFVPQQRDGCGAASVAMVMQYWERKQGQPVDPAAVPARILGALYARSAHGIYASAILRYFQENGYRAFAFAAEPSDLERELRQGRPLIVALKAGSGRELHYVVVVGINGPQRLVLVNDPEQRKLLEEDESEFVRRWKATGDWTLLAVPRMSANSPPSAP